MCIIWKRYKLIDIFLHVWNEHMSKIKINYINLELLALFIYNIYLRGYKKIEIRRIYRYENTQNKS